MQPHDLEYILCEISFDYIPPEEMTISQGIKIPVLHTFTSYENGSTGCSRSVPALNHYQLPQAKP